jgi:pantothenate kinase
MRHIWGTHRSDFEDYFPLQFEMRHRAVWYLFTDIMGGKFASVFRLQVQVERVNGGTSTGGGR